MSLTKVTYSMIQGQCVNVLDFGASPTATATANTTAIQAAINSGAASVYFPEGTYSVNSEITVPGNCHVFGDGIGQTIVSATIVGANKAIFKATGDNVGFSDITLKGPSVASYVGDESGIKFAGTSSTIYQNGFAANVEVYDIGAHGVLAEYFNIVTVQNCYLHNIGYAAINNLSSNDFIATQNVISTITPGTVGNAYGITASSRAGATAQPQRFVISNNLVQNIPIWEGIDTHGGLNGEIIGNVVSGCKVGINVTRDDNNLAPARISVIGNSIDRKDLAATATGPGIVVSGFNASVKANDIIVSGNTVVGMGAGATDSGAIFVLTSNGCLVTNNTIRAPYGNGICFYTSSTKFVVSGNTISEVTVAPATNAAGIFIYTGGETLSGLIAANYIDAADTYPIYVDGPTTGVIVGANTLITSGSAPASGTQIVGAGYLGYGLVLSGTAAPTTGNWAVGTIVYNTTPTAGGTIGFVCTTAGSPGTWKTFGAIAA